MATAMLDMLLANPLHLRPVLQNPAHRGMSVVLLHESYPYTAQGAYLATVYENVYLDLSYGLPGIGYVEMREYTRTALAVAPFTKIMYSSDGAGIPELHWSSALAGRRAIAEALGEMVACDEPLGCRRRDRRRYGAPRERQQTLRAYLSTKGVRGCR